MINKALCSKDIEKVRCILQFYGKGTYLKEGNSLWKNVLWSSCDMWSSCDSHIIDIWKMLFDYGIYPCPTINGDYYGEYYIMDLVVAKGYYNKLKFLLSYNIPIIRSVIYWQLYIRCIEETQYRCVTYDSCITLYMSYLLIYSEHWSTIIKYFNKYLTKLHRVKLKSLAPIIDFFQLHKNKPLSLETLSIIAIRKALKIGSLEMNLNSFHYPNVLKDKISLIKECEYEYVDCRNDI